MCVIPQSILPRISPSSLCAERQDLKPLPTSLAVEPLKFGRYLGDAVPRFLGSRVMNCAHIIYHVYYIYIYIKTWMCVCVDRYSCIIYIFTDRHIDRQIALNSHVLFGGSPEEKIKAAAEAVKNQTKALRLTSGDLWIPPGSTWIHSHNYGTSPFLIGKPSINGPCSMENHHFYGKSSF